MLYDTHCHLNYHSNDELTDIVLRAKEFGLTRIMQAGVRLQEVERDIEICNLFSNDDIKIHCSVAVHPENVKQEGIVSIDELKKNVVKSHHILAIGETGLDTHIPENEEFFDNQIKSFENHIECAVEMNLPIIVHSRGEKAVKKAVDMLCYYAKQNSINAVLHSYTDSCNNAKKALDGGLFISFSGIITFKNADEVRYVAKNVPLSQMLVETDAPYLAPVPMRGKQNETGFVNYTARFLSNFLNIDYDFFCTQTTKNGLRLFKERV